MKAIQNWGITLNKKLFSTKQEKQIAEFLDWHRVSGSGARPNAPGDIAGVEWLGECKTHVTPMHKIHFDLKIWNKIAEESASQFKQPAYFVDDGSQKINRTWVIFYAQDLSPAFRVCYRAEFCINNSVNFVSDKLQEDMTNQLQGAKQDYLVYQFRFGSRLVMLTDLNTFKEIV